MRSLLLTLKFFTPSVFAATAMYDATSTFETPVTTLSVAVLSNPMSRMTDSTQPCRSVSKCHCLTLDTNPVLSISTKIG